MPQRPNGILHGLHPHRIVEQIIQYLIQRKCLGDKHRHAVVEQKFHVAFFLSRNRIRQNHRQSLCNGFRDRQAARLGNDAVRRTHQHIYVVHKSHHANAAHTGIVIQKILQMLICLFIVAAHGENLKIYTGIGNMLHGLRTVSVSHAAAHDEQYRTLGIPVQAVGAPPSFVCAD